MNATTAKPSPMAICHPGRVAHQEVVLEVGSTRGVIQLAQPDEGHGGKRDQDGGDDQARDRQHPLVHLPETFGGDPGLLAARFEYRGIGRGFAQLVILERLKTLQTMLMEGDDQTDPDHDPREGVEGPDDHRGIATEKAEEKQGQSDGDLEEKSEASDTGGLLIGKMIHSHTT